MNKKKKRRPNSTVINVYTDANEEMACIAIEKMAKRTETERRFELIVSENRHELFEADAVRIALSFIPKNSQVHLFCDKQGDIHAIKTGKSKKVGLQKIIDNIKSLEKERNLIIDYKYTPRKNNYAGRLLDKI